MAGSFPQDRTAEAASDSSGDSGRDDDEISSSSQVTCRVSFNFITPLYPRGNIFGIFCFKNISLNTKFTY